MTDVLEENLDGTLILLFQHPYFWPPPQIRQFILDVYQSLATFSSDKLEAFDQTARESQILQHKDSTGNWNWSEAFSSTQLQILQNCYDENKLKTKRKTQFKFDSLFSLCLAFRHKDIHFRNLPPDAIQDLFHTEIPKTKYDQIYVTFWLTKFPKLLIFVWTKFNKLANDTVVKFSRSGDENSYQSNLVGFADMVQPVLTEMKCNGLLMERFALGSKTLEFYQLSPGLVHKIIPDGCKTASLHICRNRVLFAWGNEDNSFSHLDQGISSNYSLDGSTLVFVEKLTKCLVLETVTQYTGDKILYFTNDLAKVCTIVRQVSVCVGALLTDNPLVLNDLDNAAVQKVRNSGIMIGNKKKFRKLVDFLSRTETHNIIRGSDLTKILRRKPLWLFQNHAFPANDSQSLFVARYITALNNHYGNKFMYSKKINQRGFYKIVQQNENPKQVIYFVAGRGMGKSNVINRTAQLIHKKYKSRFVFVFSMLEVLKHLRNDVTLQNLKIGDIVEAFHEIIGQTELDRIIFMHLITNESGAQRIRVEIFFDDFDEVYEELIDLSFHVISALRDNCPAVRLWIASREHMADEIQYSFEIPAYKLVPLTMRESFKLMRGHCRLATRFNFSNNQVQKLKTGWFDHVRTWSAMLESGASNLVTVPLHNQMLAALLFQPVIHFRRDFVEEAPRRLSSPKLIFKLFELVVRLGDGCFNDIFNVCFPSLNPVDYEISSVFMNEMICSNAVPNFKFVFGTQVSIRFGAQISQDEMVEKIMLCHKIVQTRVGQMLCHIIFCGHGEETCNMIEKHGIPGTQCRILDIENFDWTWSESLLLLYTLVLYKQKYLLYCTLKGLFES